MNRPNPATTSSSFLPTGDHELPADADWEHLDGQVVAGYRVGQRLRAGVTGIVYQAQRPDASGDCALKVLNPTLSRHGAFANRYLTHQARISRAIEHPNVLRCFDVGRAGHLIYLALEAPAGPAIDEMMNTEAAPWPRDRIVEVALDVTEALAAFGVVGLVHGAVAASNVFIDDEGVAKVGDSTLARWLRGGDGESLVTLPDNESRFLPPEVVSGAVDPDAAGDCYAVGVLIHLMATGVLPSGPAAVDRAGLESAVGSELAGVVARAMAGDPGSRYQQAADLAQDLEAVAQVATANRRRAAWTFRAVLLLVLLGLAGGGWYAWSTGMIPAEYLGVITDQDQDHGPAVIETTGGEREQANGGGVGDQVAEPTSAVVVPVWVPDWAAEYGEDDYGPWATLTLAGLPVRMRRFVPSEYLMGTPERTPGRQRDEVEHYVLISNPYWLAETEVRQDLFEALTGSNPSFFKGPDRPVEHVSWEQAQVFLQSAASELQDVEPRLPTEAEWEYAARTELRHETTNDGDQWNKDTADELQTRPVAAGQPNSDGVYDLLGNVLEWVQDAYGPYDRLPRVDPVADSGIERVARGGAWSLPATQCRAQARHHYQPVKGFFFLGFRFVIDG